MHQQKINEALTETQKRIVEDLADYLVALWKLPCYDCWEEFPDYLHLYTLASIYAGLRACQQLTGKSYVGAMEEIKQYIEQNGSPKGYFVKSVGMTSVDSSLIGLCLPYELVGPDDPRMIATISKIKADLYNGRGLKRYKEDTYYGGGDWVLLAAWLGWYDARIGQRKAAIALRDWIESVADESGQLPEQVPFALNAPSQYEYWVNRWGEIARPLLWSHAMYLILVNELAKSA
jgi:GH15 family glucan-1,4-alpha-glucosidase